MPISYYQMINNVKVKFNFRYHLVEYAKTHSIAEAAREFQTTRKTIRKWLGRYRTHSLKGLEDKSKRPHRIPHKLKELDENRIHLTREKYPQWGPKRLKMLARLPYGASSIYRVLKQRGLCHKQKKYVKKRDLRAWKKANYKAFEKMQIDVKYLNDIPELYPAFRLLGLPKFEFTARCIISGATFVSYGFTKSGTNAAIFLDYVMNHLKYHGVDITHMEVQYDNANEFIGHSLKKRGPSLFQQKINEHNLAHGRIPVSRPTFNSDVESFHRTIEQEFYSCTAIESKTHFFAAAYSYMLFYNYFRPNSWKENLSPHEIVKKHIPNADENVLNLPPIQLEHLIPQLVQAGGYHLPEFPTYLLRQYNRFCVKGTEEKRTGVCSNCLKGSASMREAYKRKEPYTRVKSQILQL